MPVSAHFLEALRDAFRFVPELSTRRMFGGAGVYSGGLMFAAVMDDTIYLKSDAQTDAAFDALGLAPFIFRDRNGRELAMSYRAAPEVVWEDPEEARAWVDRAIGAALRTKASSPAARPRRKS